MTTSYDRVAYPTTVFTQTHPERLAAIMTLAGLTPVPPAQSRILEIGGGTCLNLLSFAAMWPECQAYGFDLSGNAIARGQQIRDASGLSNAVLAVDDICEAQKRYPAKSFDYVIVHGVYAWVPDHVRVATMKLVAHVLSDRGVALVSYNCMPGGHVRLIMREMLLHQIGHIDDPAHKIAALRDFLEDYARPREGDEPLAVTLRQQAESMLKRPDAVLFHDELGDCYHPLRMADVVAAAREHGLTFLSDAGRNRHLDGFLADGNDGGDNREDAVLRAAYVDDYAALRYFRHSLFVRDCQRPERRIDPTRIADLWLSTRLTRTADGDFVKDGDTLSIANDALAAGLDQAAQAWPQRVPVSDLTSDPALLRVILQLFAEWYVDLHTAPAPFAAEAGERPATSPLVRGLLSMGESVLCTLNHTILRIDQPELQALLVAADGRRTLAELGQVPTGLAWDDVQPVLDASAGKALLLG